VVEAVFKDHKDMLLACKLPEEQVSSLYSRSIKALLRPEEVSSLY